MERPGPFTLGRAKASTPTFQVHRARLAEGRIAQAFGGVVLSPQVSYCGWLLKVRRLSALLRHQAPWDVTHGTPRTVQEAQPVCVVKNHNLGVAHRLAAAVGARGGDATAGRAAWRWLKAKERALAWGPPLTAAGS